MANFSVTLFAEGDHVRVMDGPFKGQAGTVAAWRRIAADHPDVEHIIRLDEPITVPAKVIGTNLIEPEHRVETVGVPASALELVE